MIIINRNENAIVWHEDEKELVFHETNISELEEIQRALKELDTYLNGFIAGFSAPIKGEQK
jgi:hypothetical protein